MKKRKSPQRDTSPGNPKRKISARGAAGARDALQIQQRLEVERAMGMKRGTKKKS